jgi:hypothetical protein
MRALGLVWDDDLDIWRRPEEAPGIGGRVYSVHTMQAGERRLERRSPGVRERIRRLIDEVDLGAAHRPAMTLALREAVEGARESRAIARRKEELLDALTGPMGRA